MKTIDYSKLELTGLPIEYFQQNLQRYIANVKKIYTEFIDDTILVLQAGEEKDLYASDKKQYYFFQEANFYYLTGVTEPGLIAVLDFTQKSIILFYDEPSEDDNIFEKVITKEDLKVKYKCDVLDKSTLNAFIKSRNPERISLLEGVNDYSQLPVLTAKLDFKDEYEYLNKKVIHDDIYYEIIKDTRTVKASYEIDLMAFINKITIEAHLEMMKHIKDGLYERDLEMIFTNYLYKNYYTRIWAYPCIAGGCGNSATLHYEVNDKKLTDGGLFLADMGVRFCGYTSDITITIPINGKFTQKQKLIYDIVLKSNKETTKIIRPGTKYADMDKLSKMIILEELQKIGMLLSGFSIDEMFNDRVQSLFMAHGLGHFVGLEVHDIGKKIKYKKELILEAGNIITVEPGIYFVDFVFNNAFKNEKLNKYLNEAMIRSYMGFGGVRIEDDILVTENGSRNLTSDLPRETEAIEAFMDKY